MFSKYSFLYVEDDPLSRQIMSMIMKKAMQVANLIMFEDSKDFLARARALVPRPDMILLDIHVRPVNGFQMLEMIRNDPELEKIQVMALTASVMNEEVERLRTAYFDGAIAKPLSVVTFPDLIARSINGESVWHIT